MDFWTIIADLGMPIAAAIACGVFHDCYKLHIKQYCGPTDFIKNVIESLDNRIKTMNNDILKIDNEVSQQLGLPVRHR